MGFGSFFKRLVKIKPKKLLTVVKKATTAVATGGLSLVAPKAVQPILERAFTSPVAAIKAGIALKTGNYPGVIAAYLPSGSTISSRPIPTQGSKPMGFNLGAFLQGAAGAVGTLTKGTAYAGAGQLVSSFASAIPVQSRGPQPYGGYGGVPQAPQVRPQLPGARSPISALGRGLSAQSKSTLLRIAGWLGRRTLSMPNAISIIRKLSKTGLAPAAIATALGISLGLLAELITEHAAKKPRRMNPANVHALRRSMRRITSFHKLCVRADKLRSRGRTRSRAVPCR